MNKLIHLLFKIVFYVALVLITAFLLMPLPAGGESLINDKVAHGLIFFILSVLIHRAYPHSIFIRTLAPVLAVYGFLIEVVQGLLGYRTFSLLDFAADIAGIVVYLCVLVILSRLFHTQTTRA